ncbi:beta-mannosidase [Bacteroidia bacterium]|nr:beta-mannosidase [Bacteroidia bacterium]
MGTLTKNGVENVEKATFDTSWWYRTEFLFPELKPSQHVFLDFEGLSYSANIWLNGQLLASRDTIYGPFRQFSFDITSLLEDKNVLAVEIFKAQAGDPNIGFVDWNPRPEDENRGLFREVKLHITGDVRMQNTCVRSDVNTETLEEAELTIQTGLENLSNQPVSGKLVGKIENHSFAFPVVLQPGEKKTITLTPNEIKNLHITRPRLWWCNGLGNPELYTLDLAFEKDDTISAKQQTTFGIRKIETYFTEKGHRGFKLNGKEILIKGAGWTDDIYLRDTPETNEMQVQYVKDMNLNLIRFENIWGTSQNIYDLCDRYGILAMVGWSCQWEWQEYFGKPCDGRYGCITSEKDINLIAQSFQNQVVWLRNHPAIMAWLVGSDMLPCPALEQKYLDILQQTDDRPCVMSAGMYSSELTGSTGMKMYGPYEYVGPNYWYIDTLHGGAYGFNTETGIGAQLPVKESIQKMFPADELWPINENWNAHCTVSKTAMNSLHTLTEVMNHKYGEAKNLDDYLQKADVLNYDGTRAMFEAFRANRSQSTGVVQWMLNSAWPSLYWQLYDYYKIPTAAYYAVKKANAPQQLIYNPKENAIYAVNEALNDFSNAQAIIRLYSTNSGLLYEEKIPVSVPAGTSKKIVELPTANQDAFLSLQIVDKKQNLLADNFYCLSAKQDEYDWANTNWVHTPLKSYADFRYLENLPEAELKIHFVKNETKGVSPIILEIINTSPVIAYFIQFKLKDETGEMLYPVFWSDNYISLFPGEKRIINCHWDEVVLKYKQAQLFIKGWNFTENSIPVPQE